MIDTQSAITEYHARQATKKAERTAERYTRDVREWAEWLQSPGSLEWDPNKRNRNSKTLFEATTGDVRTYLRQMLNHGDYAGGTVKIRQASISTFYQEVQEMAEEGFDVPDMGNPAEWEALGLSDWQQLKKGTKKEQELKEQVHYLTPEEIDKLANNVPTPTLRNTLIVRILYQTGLRRKELAQTRIDDVDTEERAINVRATKTHLNRTVWYQPSLDGMMNRWLNVERKSYATADSPYLFCSIQSGQISPKHINYLIQQAADDAGLQSHLYTDAAGKDHNRVSAHTLRHSYAVQSLKNGMDTRTLQKLLGHADISTTEKYLRLAKEDKRNAARKYGAGTERD